MVISHIYFSCFTFLSSATCLATQVGWVVCLMVDGQIGHIYAISWAKNCIVQILLYYQIPLPTLIFTAIPWQIYDNCHGNPLPHARLFFYLPNHQQFFHHGKYVLTSPPNTLEFLSPFNSCHGRSLPYLQHGKPVALFMAISLLGSMELSVEGLWGMANR